MYVFIDLGNVLEQFAVALNLYQSLVFGMSSKAVLLLDHVVFPDIPLNCLYSEWLLRCESSKSCKDG